MKKTILRKNGCIYCVVARNTQELAKIFVRLQEFYESPFKGIRGNYFTLKQFKAIYSKDKDGVFTYYDDWAGFNVPGHIVVEFFNLFTDLSPRERMLKKMLAEPLASGEIFYVMGVPRRQSRSIVEHETAHALFYTNPSYKKAMLSYGHKLSPKVRAQVFKKLKSMGYSGTVKFDELQAYMSTSRVADLIHWFGKGITVNHAKPFKTTFKKYFN
jgi:hypothetical protein